jgi:hypothetical protein
MREMFTFIGFKYPEVPPDVLNNGENYYKKK